MNHSRGAEFQRRVAAIALSACREQGFALAGGQALIAHGIVNRAEQFKMASMVIASITASVK